MVVKNITRLYYHVWYILPFYADTSMWRGRSQNQDNFACTCRERERERERDINEKNTELDFAHGTKGGAVPELPD